MLPETMEHELTREPFVPLRLYLDNGRTYLIDDPGRCFITRGSMYIARIDRPHSHLADDLDLISLRHIVSIEQAPDADTSA